MQATFLEPDWQNAFWGSNYKRLSEIKAKSDLNNLFWVSPGINADHMKVVDKRLCKSSPPTPPEPIAPKTDNQKVADRMVLMERFGKTELIGTFPPPGKFIGLQN